MLAAATAAMAVPMAARLPRPRRKPRTPRTPPRRIPEEGGRLAPSLRLRPQRKAAQLRERDGGARRDNEQLRLERQKRFFGGVLDARLSEAVETRSTGVLALSPWKKRTA